jgi:hypothetical protein
MFLLRSSVNTFNAGVPLYAAHPIICSTAKLITLRCSPISNIQLYERIILCIPKKKLAMELHTQLFERPASP